MKFIKSMSKRTLALILALMMMLSSGIIGAVAANVELAPVGAETITVRYQKDMPGGNYDASNSLTLTQSANNSNRYSGTVSLQANSSYGFFVKWGNDYYKVNTTASQDVSVQLYSYGSSNYGNSNHRVTFTTSTAGNYIFTFDTSNKKIVVSPESDTVKLAYDVASGHDNWYNLDNYATFTRSSGSTYILDLELSAQKYYMFVQLKNSAYWRGTSTLTTTQAASVYSYGTDNYGGSADKLNFTPSSAGTYRFTWNQADKTLSVAKLSYNVKKTESGGTGTVKLGDTTISTSDTSISPGSHTLTITAPNGYNVSNVSVSGGSLTTAGTTGSSTYSGTVNVSAATTINVTYTSAAHTYTVTAGTGGTITSTASGSVTPGSGVTVTAKANEGYTFTGWTGTNGSFADDKAISTTFTPSATGATAKANFTINSYDFSMSCQAPANSTWGTISAETTDGALTSGDKVNYNKEITLKADLTADYNFVGWTIVNNGVTTTSSDLETTITVKGNVTVTAEVVAKEYHTITYSANVEPGSFSVAGNTVTPVEEGKSYRIESGNAYTVTVAAPDGYYIKSIGSNNYDETTVSKTVSYQASDSLADKTINIVFETRPTYTVIVVNNDENMGSLNATTKTDLYMDAKFIIKPTAKEGFQFKGWNVVGPSEYAVAADGTITITVKGTETNKVTTVTANWEKKTNFTVTLKAPASMGWASGTGTDANLGAISLDTKADTATLNSADVSAGTVLTFTANTWDDPYVFDKWDIQGNYTNETTSGNTLTLTANGEVTVTAKFKTGNLTIYATNVPSNWSQSKLYCYYSTGNGNAVFEMSYDSSKSMWYTTVPDGLTWIKFMDQGQDNATNYKQFDKNPILNGDVFKINAGTVTAGSSTSAGPTTYELTGGVSLKLENYGDGNHIGSIEIPAGTTSITVNPYGSDKKYWNYYRNYSGTSVEIHEGSTTVETPVTINLGENANGVTLDVSFNPSTQTFSWTVTQMKATVNITVNYGMNQNEADPHDGQDIAKTYYKVDGEIVYSFTEGNGNVAKIAEGEMATVYTEIYASAYQNGKPIHRVEGWVLDGVEFIPASSNDGKTFYGTYKYTKDAEITPIFFHTDEWLTTNNVSTVTVYAVLDTLDDTTPDHEIEEWQQGISSYTWFYPSSSDPTSKYCQFDTWTGQYMIPVGNNVFKTYVETKGASGPDYEERSFNGLDISGITFTNVMKATQDTNDWVQAYDYYEFKSLIDDGRFNITYVLRNHNTNVNKGDFTTGTGSTININNFQWMNYIDYSGDIMDIYRNVTKAKSTTTPDNTLYILREGPYKVDDGKANGEFYLYSNVYDANGNYIDRCLTYELVDPESEFFTILKNKEAAIQTDYPTFTYVGGNVQISYEAENNKDYNGNTQATRFDGEWYGDLTDTTKVDIDVLVGFTEDNGTTIDVEDTNANDYGTATINGKAEDEVTRGTYATLLASEKTGYKFIGWYNTKKDGDTVVATTLLTEDYTIDVEASVAATYVAVYRTRTGGEFDVLNLKYAGDTSDPSVPFAHGGESYRYVSVVHTHVNGTTSVTNYDKQANGVSIPNATEGDKLEITIYTDAFYPEDYFYAWYMEVRDSSGKIVNFEEVGVDKSHVGSKEEVSFTFEYVVKQGDNGITIYSDIYHKEITKDIIYLYQDRYNNTKQYIKSKYTLVGDELITGVPSEETIIKYAPWVEDLYKDTQWIFDEEKFTEDSWTLVATQAPTVYTVNVYTGMNRKQFTGVYDTPVEVLATTIDPNATNNGYWYEDCGTVSGSYDSGDKILAYGAYYGLLIKKNVDIGYYYSPELELDFTINLDEPIYGREQSGVDGAIDKIFVDYHTSVHVPYFDGNTLLNGNKITDVYYEGETFVSANSPVTLETLEKFGYEVEYGIITEQVGTFKIEDGAYADFATAQNAAIAEGYQTKTTDDNLEKVVASDLTKGWGKSFGIDSVKKGTSDEYYTVYTLTDEDFISNKNRFPFTLVFNNTSANRGRFYNVYGYIALTYTPVGSTTSVTDYYFSNMQTLNFHEAGTNTSAAYNNN